MWKIVKNNLVLIANEGKIIRPKGRGFFTNLSTIILPFLVVKNNCSFNKTKI
jgi:hypothetical protein